MNDKNNKNSRYQRLFLQIQELLRVTANPVSRMATISAVLHHKMDYFFWTGFYIYHDGDLLVGPYQGPLACQILERDKGVCWAAFNRSETIVVPDVHKFPGHIACSSLSNSEIVIPFGKISGEPLAVLDVDSREYNSFDSIDAEWLEKIVNLIYL